MGGGLHVLLFDHCTKSYRKFAQTKPWVVPIQGGHVSPVDIASTLSTIALMSKPNWVNRTIWTGDNLPIMRGMNSSSVDLIYLDPPFNSNTNYAAPVGSEAAGAEFKDTWTLQDVDITWLDLLEAKHPSLNRVIHAATIDSDKSYLVYMAVRLLEMHRILRPNGSIYLHCDPYMSHYLKIVLDAIFGRKQFKREVIWNLQTASGFKSQVKGYVRGHDTLLYYTRGGGIYIQ